VLHSLSVAAGSFLAFRQVPIPFCIGKYKGVVGQPLADEATEEGFGLRAGLHDGHGFEQQPGAVGWSAVDEDVLVADQVASGENGGHLSAWTGAQGRVNRLFDADRRGRSGGARVREWSVADQVASGENGGHLNITDMRNCKAMAAGLPGCMESSRKTRVQMTSARVWNQI
jgi:hypothetical protein